MGIPEVALFLFHQERLYDRVKEYTDKVFLMTGNNSKKEHKEICGQLKKVPSEETLILVATGSLIGEGFDFPRLDTYNHGNTGFFSKCGRTVCRKAKPGL